MHLVHGSLLIVLLILGSVCASRDEVARKAVLLAGRGGSSAGTSRSGLTHKPDHAIHKAYVAHGPAGEAAQFEAAGPRGGRSTWQTLSARVLSRLSAATRSRRRLEKAISSAAAVRDFDRVTQLVAEWESVRIMDLSSKLKLKQPLAGQPGLTNGSGINQSAVGIGDGSQINSAVDRAEAEAVAVEEEVVTDVEEVAEIVVSETSARLLALTWALGVASLPVVVIYLDASSVAAWQYTQAVVLFVWVGIGLYVCEYCLLFDVVGEEDPRVLSSVETVYFLAQLITTVGFGDIAPATGHGKAVVAIYVMVSVLFVARVVGEEATAVWERLDSCQADASDDLLGCSSLGAAQPGSPVPPAGPARRISILPLQAAISHPLQNFYMTGSFFVCVVATWTVVMVNLPGERFTIGEALYQSIIVFSTVGLGGDTGVPHTHAGMIFTAYICIVGAAALAGTIAAVCEVIVAWKSADESVREKRLEALETVCEQLKFPAEARLEQLDFLQFALVYDNAASVDDLRHYARCFRRHQPDKEGKVRFSMVASVEAEAASEERSSTPNLPSNADVGQAAEWQSDGEASHGGRSADAVEAAAQVC
eukprot:TRINITY_DN10736_c0_g1_i2.p1 TRINITY_DN10736_c0_g1~~TRINITY_DN10736_c0_g1_i2.p1  ORF type:complete len:592 (-),score=104.42 TRINITY_DN10736_c0_g1_i2:227-2002(-)